MAIVPQIDFAPIGQLADVYREGRQRAMRERLLADAGNGDPQSLASTAMKLAQAGDLQGAQSLATIQKSLAPETSADMQAYGLYRRQGGALPFLDFKKQLAEAGATRVTTNVSSGEKEYDKALNKDLADVFLGYQKAGRTAAGAKNTLDLMEGLTQNPNFYSGFGGEMATKGKQALVSLGVADPKSASANELFQSFGNKLVMDAAGGSLGNQISNSDVRYINATVPGLDKTPEGNREMIGIQRKVYGRQQEVAKMARDYAQKNGGRLDYKFDELLADYAEKNPLFPQKSGSGNPAPRQQTAPTQQQAPRQAPDGNFYVPDPDRPGKYLRVIQ